MTRHPADHAQCREGVVGRHCSRPIQRASRMSRPCEGPLRQVLTLSLRSLRVGSGQRPASMPSHSFAAVSTAASAWARGISMVNDQPSDGPAVAKSQGMGITSNPRRR